MAEIPMSGVTGGGVGLRATMRIEAPANSSATATPRVVGTAPPPEPEWSWSVYVGHDHGHGDVYDHDHHSPLPLGARVCRGKASLSAAFRNVAALAGFPCVPSAWRGSESFFLS